MTSRQRRPALPEAAAGGSRGFFGTVAQPTKRFQHELTGARSEFHRDHIVCKKLHILCPCGP